MDVGKRLPPQVPSSEALEIGDTPPGPCVLEYTGRGGYLAGLSVIKDQGARIRLSAIGLANRPHEWPRTRLTLNTGDGVECRRVRHGNIHAHMANHHVLQTIQRKTDFAILWDMSIVPMLL